MLTLVVLPVSPRSVLPLQFDIQWSSLGGAGVAHHAFTVRRFPERKRVTGFPQGENECRESELSFQLEAWTPVVQVAR